MPRVVGIVEIESRMVVAGGWGRRNGEFVSNGYRLFIVQNEKTWFTTM